jgi:hypothetical protein
VLIQITRAGVSPLDDKIRRGILPPRMRKPLPLVPGIVWLNAQRLP